MTFKFLKAGLVSLMISNSGFASAGIVLFEWMESTGSHSLTWSLHDGQLPLYQATTWVDYEVTVSRANEDGMIEEYEGWFSAFTDEDMRGIKLFSPDLGMLINIGGDMVYTAESTGIEWDIGNHEFATSWSTYTLKISEEVPEPTGLAILALGIMGLASRKFKKQS